jgi:hypothetical protein
MTLEQRVEALEREVSELKRQEQESSELVMAVQHATQAAAHDLQQIVAQQQATIEVVKPDGFIALRSGKIL